MPQNNSTAQVEQNQPSEFLLNQLQDSINRTVKALSPEQLAKNYAELSRIQKEHTLLKFTMNRDGKPYSEELVQMMVVEPTQSLQQILVIAGGVGMSGVPMSHRLMEGYEALEVEDMTGAIETSLFKASAVLGLVSMSVVESTIIEINRDQVYWSIQSALSDLGDITAVIDAYHLANIQAQKNPEL